MKINKKICLFSLALCPLLGLADDEVKVDNGDTKSYTLQKSVVSATGFEQEIKDAPASMSVVTQKYLQEIDYHDLAEALVNVPGVDIGTEQGKTGGFNISIRGLPSNYTLYLVNGLRQNVAGNVGTNNGGWNQALNVFMPPRVAIQRIEVIRGPMSTIYGSDAMGGVVNVILKEPNLKKYEGAIELNASVNENEQFGDYYTTNFYASAPIIKDKLAIALRGTYMYRSPSSVNFQYTDIHGVKKEAEPGYIGNPTEGNIYDIGVRVGYQMDEQNYFYFDIDNGYQNYDNRKKQLGDFTSSPPFYLNYRFNEVLAHIGSYDWGKTKTTLQWNNTTNKGRVVPYQESLTNAEHENRDIKGNDMIFQSQVSIPLYTSTTFADNITMGVQYWLQTFHDKPYGNNFYPWSNDSANTDKATVKLVNTNYNPYAASIHAVNNQVAAYIEHETTFIQDIILTLGARYTYDQQFGSNISPRAYLIYNTTDWLQFRGGVSTAYKSPYIGETELAAFGYGAQGGLPFLGNKDLKPETSISYEAGFGLDFDYFDFQATYFYNKYQDKIASQTISYNSYTPAGLQCVNPHVVGHDPASGCSVRINVDGAYSQGVEVALALKPIYNFSLDANYTFMMSEQLTGKNKGSPVLNTPKNSVNVNLHYNILGYADVYIQGRYKSERWRGLSSKKDVAAYDAAGLGSFYKPYYVVNIGVNYNINKNFRINFGIQNLFNKNFIDYYAYGEKKTKTGATTDQLANMYSPSAEGRKYFMTLSARF